MIMRLRDQRRHCLFTACLSVLALHYGVSRPFWAILTRIRLVLALDTTKHLALDIGVRLTRTALARHRRVRLCIADNKSIHNRIAYQHADRGGDMVHFVNWVDVQFPGIGVSIAQGEDIPASLVVPADFVEAQIVPLFDPLSMEFDKVKQEIWISWCRLDQETLLIGRPTQNPAPQRMDIVIMEPIMNAGTAAYKDVERLLDEVRRVEIDIAGAEVVVVAGDHQTFTRMLHLKFYSPQRYRWLLPWWGALHFEMNSDMGLWSKWNAFLSTCVAWMQFGNTLKTPWTDSCEWSHYARFITLVTISGILYLRALFGDSRALDDPARLLFLCRGNPGLITLIRFLRDDGLPRLALIAGVRCDHRALLNWFWRYNLPLFRATNVSERLSLSLCVKQRQRIHFSFLSTSRSTTMPPKPCT